MTEQQLECTAVFYLLAGLGGDFIVKYFLEIPPGFTKFYCIEFHMGTVAMKRLCANNPEDVPVTKELLKNIKNGKRLQGCTKLFPDSDPYNIEAQSIAKIFPDIPPQELPYYPRRAA